MLARYQQVPPQNNGVRRAGCPEFSDTEFALGFESQLPHQVSIIRQDDMTINPQTCLTPCAEELAQATAMSTAIDALLQKNFDSPTASVNYSIPPKTSNRALTKVITQYQAVGWNVQVNTYRNEKTNLVFTQGPNTSSIVVTSTGTLQVVK